MLSIRPFFFIQAKKTINFRGCQIIIKKRRKKVVFFQAYDMKKYICNFFFSFSILTLHKNSSQLLTAETLMYVTPFIRVASIYSLVYEMSYVNNP